MFALRRLTADIGRRERDLTMKSYTATARYKRTLQRITAEVSWLFTEQTALVALSEVDAHGLDFFRVAFTALLGDRLLRLVRVLEEDSQVASFWYLHRCNPKRVEQALDKTGINVADLRDFSHRLKSIRDKTFVHIDKAGVFDPEQIYKDAGIKNSDVDKVVKALWVAMKALYELILGQAYPHDTYSGSDIADFQKYRDESKLIEEGL